MSSRDFPGIGVQNIKFVSKKMEGEMILKSSLQLKTFRFVEPSLADSAKEANNASARKLKNLKGH